MLIIQLQHKGYFTTVRSRHIPVCFNHVLLLLLLSGLPRLQPAFTYRAWFQADDPYLIAFQDFQQTFGNDDVLVCVVHRSAGLFDPEGAKLLAEVTDGLLDLKDVERVSSLSTFDWIGDASRGHRAGQS